MFLKIFVSENKNVSRETLEVSNVYLPKKV